MVTDLIREYVETLTKGKKARNVTALKNIFETAVRLTQEAPGTLNLKIASTTLKELRYSFRMFAPQQDKPKITVFGSARVPPEAPLYQLAKEFSALAVKNGYQIITGGGPGIMEAGNEGGTRKDSYGLNIELPFEQSANRHIDTKNKFINYKYFFTRKLFLVKEACAFAIFPGGFGTLDETFEVLTLIQTGKNPLVPIVFVEPPEFGYWQEVWDFIYKKLGSLGYISKTDNKFFTLVHTKEQAIDHINHFYKNYHSSRYVGDLIVIRIEKNLSNIQKEEIRDKYVSLSSNGKFNFTQALPEEKDDPKVFDLPRIVFPFDRKEFGDLRLFIDHLNSL